MVPKIHAKGKSFKGAAAYLLHDKERAKSVDRVAWTEVRNLATENPNTAWKVMAATAMKQKQLKEAAGVKQTGRKSSDSVLHLSIAWHPEEKAGLTREEMMRSAIGALRAIGASDRQALVICHTDEKQPHVHILVNRVSQEDGRMLSSSNEKIELSKWAQAYEKERGQIYCEERVLNNQARARKKYTRGKKDQARHLYEEEQAKRPNDQAKAEQRNKDAAAAKETRETKERHRQEWIDLQKGHKEREAEIRAQAVKDTAKGKEAAREQLRPEFHMLFHEHQIQMRQFLEKEQHLLGRVQNALKTIDFKAIIAGDQTDRTRRQALGEAFGALSSAGSRLEALKREQAKEKRVLEIRENKAEREIAQQAQAKRDNALAQNRTLFKQQRNDLILTQRLEGVKLRADWKTRHEQRSRAWENNASLPSGKTPANQNEAALIAEKLRLIESFKQRVKQSGQLPGRDHDRERGD